MTYLLTQIVFSLAMAGVVGCAIGWLINGYRAYSRQQRNHSELMRQSLLLSQAEADNKMIEEDFRELKHRAEETVTLLKEESRQIPELKKNLEKSQTLVRQLLQKHDAELRQLTSENSNLKNKMRELENREKAVTLLQMDLNSERLKMRSDSSNRSTKKSTESAKAAPFGLVTESATAANPGLTEQTEIPLSSEVVTKPTAETDSLYSSSDSSSTIDDILNKADDVLNRFRDDPSVELDAFQRELDQELDAIRHDLDFEPEIITEVPDTASNDANSNQTVADADVPSNTVTPLIREPAKAEPTSDVINESTISSTALEPESIEAESLEQESASSADTNIPFHQVYGSDFTPPAHTDELQHIFGIGPVTERTLNSIGIISYEQLAKFDREHIEYVAEVLQIFPGRIERDNWVGSALKLVTERQSELEHPSDTLGDQPRDPIENENVNRLEDA